jgi:hypothetical protein
VNDPDARELGIPDGIEPLVGWRYWRADEGWLCSLNKFKTWPAGRPLRAQCTLAMDHGPLPGERCGCGIYAAIDLPTLKELVQPDLESPLVVGEVSLWGKVIPAELGFRAELAYPRRVWVVNDSVATLDGRTDAPLALANRYGIPVEPCDATWAVSEEAVNPWHLEPRVGEIRAAVAAFKQEVDRLAAALAQGDEMFRTELARLRGAPRTEAIARSAFQGSFGHLNEGKAERRKGA